MPLVSALDKIDDLQSLENTSEDLETDLETDFEKHDDGIGFSTPARIYKTTTRKQTDASCLVCQRTFRTSASSPNPH